MSRRTASPLRWRDPSFIVWLIWLSIAAALLLMFLLFAALGIDFQGAVINGLSGRSVSAAVLGASLLVLDVILPVPSSVVMSAHGAVFGVFLGTIISTCGCVAATAFAAGLGRAGRPLLERVAPEESRAYAESILSRFGFWGIALTRPIPILAETTAVVAGVHSISWRTILLSSLAGAVPTAMLFAVIGAGTAHAIGRTAAVASVLIP